MCVCVCVGETVHFCERKRKWKLVDTLYVHQYTSQEASPNAHLLIHTRLFMPSAIGTVHATLHVQSRQMSLSLNKKIEMTARTPKMRKRGGR